jgi:hypothetical protein
MFKENRKNFEAITNLKPLKKNAVEKCGQEFVKELNNKGLNIKDNDFWQEVNKKLGIPDNAHSAKEKQEWEEKEQQKRERVDRETTEKNRLLDSKKQVEKSTRDNWEITVYELLPSDIFGNKFIAMAKKEFGEVDNKYQFEESTDFCDTFSQAYSTACNLADNRDRDEEREIEFQKRYRVLKPLYLVAIYLFSWDDFCTLDRAPREPEARHQFYLEYFNGVSSYGLEFDILNRLEKEGLMGFSNSKKTISINKDAVKQAVEAANRMNIPGTEDLLNDKVIHLECLDYKNYRQRMWEQSEEDIDED